MQKKRTVPPSSSAPTVPDELLSFGYITQAHGLNGEVRLHLHNPQSESLQQIKSFLVLTPGKPTIEEIPVLQIRDHPKGVIVKFKGANDRNQAEALKRSEVFIPRDALPPLEEGEFYYFQLIGFPVFSTDGDPLGTVSRVMPGPSYPILVVAHQEREVFVPLVDAIVPLFDLNAKRIEVEASVGLFDLDEESEKKEPHKGTE